MRGYSVTLVLALSLSAAAAQPQPKSDPCALATKAEIQEAVGKTVSDGKINSINKSICDFTITETGFSVSLMLVNKAPGDSAEKIVAEMKKRKIDAEVVSGFGDGAYATNPGMGMRQLGVYKGTKHVIVTLMLPGAPAAKSKTAAEQVMRKVLSHM